MNDIIYECENVNEWDDIYSVGISIIDEEQIRLGIINKNKLKEDMQMLVLTRRKCVAFCFRFN